MANLVYYKAEKITFKTAFEKQLTIAEAEIIFKKLVRHFKLGQVYLSWTSGRNHPRANGSRVLLNTDWNNFGVLCHELAHTKQIVKGNQGHNWHNKRHQRFMRSMIAYCARKNWFAEELNKRTAPKPINPEPTKDELKQLKIIKAEEKIKKYLEKIKMWQKKLSKVNRSLAMLKKR